MSKQQIIKFQSNRSLIYPQVTGTVQYSIKIAVLLSLFFELKSSPFFIVQGIASATQTLNAYGSYLLYTAVGLAFTSQK